MTYLDFTSLSYKFNYEKAHHKGHGGFLGEITGSNARHAAKNRARRMEEQARREQEAFERQLAEQRAQAERNMQMQQQQMRQQQRRQEVSMQNEQNRRKAEEEYKKNVLDTENQANKITDTVKPEYKVETQTNTVDNNFINTDDDEKTDEKKRLRQAFRGV